MRAMLTLCPDVQQYIDARLDAIERVLLTTNTSRRERREIVQSVEDQIYEMLGRRDAEPTSDGVLEILGALDPPEAYLAADTSILVDGHPRSREVAPVTPTEVRRRISPLAIVSCALGALCLLSIVLWPVSLVSGLAAAVCGAVALTQIYYVDHIKGIWPSIIGVSAPAIAMLTFIILVGL